MPDDPQGAPAASPKPDALAAPSAESQPVTEQVSEQTPPPTSQPDPSQGFNLPPKERWDQLRQERQEALQRADRAEAMTRMALEKLQVAAPQPEQESDPYAGMDPTVAEQYRALDRRIEQRAAIIADQKLQGVMQAVNAGRQELASIKVAQFRKEIPDIKPGSPEEATIAQFVQQGHDIDTAKKLAMYDRVESELHALKS